MVLYYVTKQHKILQTTEYEEQENLN